MMIRVCCALLVLAAACFTAQAAIGRTCLDESECDAGECCQILSEFMVVSKRQADLIKGPVLAQKTGTCQRYKLEGEHCNGFDKMNGYCSCGPDLRCHTYEVALPTMAPTSSHIVRKGMLPPRPGYQWVSQCEKKP